MLVIPGGFSYGDDIASGVVLATELVSFLRDQLQEFVEAGKLILGICNGFQVLVRTGLLPLGELGCQETTLTYNDSNRFECRWVKLFIPESPCVFTSGLVGETLQLPVAHGEGKFVAPPPRLHAITEMHKLCAFTYADGDTSMTYAYPANPNGSLMGIAGVCNPSGRILGLMPHPERFVDKTQHPNWRRGESDGLTGLSLFENAVRFVRDL